MSDIELAAGQVNHGVATSPTLLGKECIGCLRVLEYNFYQRDSSCRDGRRDLCDICASTPRMSVAEHTARLREQNMNSGGVRRQQWDDIETWKNDVARIGKAMRHTDFLEKLRRITTDLYICDGNIAGDLAVFRIYGQPQPRLDGKTFEYLFYIPTGTMPEYSLIEFDSRDIPVREKERGWRTPLLRLILAGVITREQCDRVFGRAEGEASYQWHRQLAGL